MAYTCIAVSLPTGPGFRFTVVTRLYSRIRGLPNPPVRYIAMDGLERWALAATAGALSEAVTYPLDLIKTRLQLQNELGRSITGDVARAHLSYTQMFVQVAKSEGFAALFAGSGVAMARQTFNAGVSVALYPTIRRSFLSEGESAANAPLWKRAMAGAVTGGVGQLLAQPADVVKVRVQADGRNKLLGKPPRYTGALECARQIVAAEGLMGFYAALRSSVWRGAVINSAGIASYDATKQATIRLLGTSEGVLPQLVGSLCTGVVTAVVSAPLDVVKTRLMANPSAYSSPSDCLRQLIKTEGIASIYKGLVPTYKRQAIFNFVFWLSLEHLQEAFGSERL